MNKHLAFYMRVSKQELEENESNSISNQRLLLQGYIKQKQELFDYKTMEFFDDGVTGANFERPAFEKLLAEIRKGFIDCIIVKDAYVKQRIKFLNSFSAGF